MSGIVYDPLAPPPSSLPKGSKQNLVRLCSREMEEVSELLRLMEWRLDRLHVDEQEGFITRCRAYITKRWPWAYPWCHVTRDRSLDEVDWFFVHRCHCPVETHEDRLAIVDSLAKT